MKTLREHVILYDEACPMCNLYTRAFVKYKFLDKQGRASYQNMPKQFTCNIDAKRAVNEIALVNKKTGEVTYGVNSLIKILSQRFPVLKLVFQFKVFNWLATKAYRFVSYNRRIIMPALHKQEEQHEPSLHKGYRIAYLLLTWLFTALVLNAYSKTFTELLPPSTIARELFICGGQMLWQGAILYCFNRKKIWDYLGNMMTISFAGALLLSICLLFQSLFITYNSLIAIILFFVVVGLMFLEHIRRTKLLQLPWLLTASWVLYRCIVLIFIL